MSRPNILLIVTDQHRSDHTGFGGNTVVQTPNLDALAARGTVFTEAFVSNPICMPNRSTMITGRMPSAHGTRFNGISLNWNTSTAIRQLMRSGYTTGLVGKAHLQNMGNGASIIGAVRKRFFKEHAAMEDPMPYGWDLLENEQRYREGDVTMPPDFYGFGHCEFAVGHADLVSGHYWRWLVDKGIDPTTMQGAKRSPQTYAGWWQIWQSAMPVELYPTTFVGERSAAFVTEAAAGDAPWFLQCSFPDPHHPFSPPGEYYDMYTPGDIPLPATFDDDHKTSMTHLQKFRATRGEEPPPMAVLPFSPTEEIFREAAAKEYGAITLIDKAIGTVLDAVAASGQADNTVVIFTSDHGEMFGDHGLMLKASMHYLGALRVPLVIADPRPEAAVSATDELASTIDLASTFLDLGEVGAYEGMQGFSLVPLTRDPAASVRTEVLVEEDEPFDLAGLGAPLRMRTLITKDSRVSVYQGSDRGELFDLTDDPDEMRNVFDDPGARLFRGDMTERLARSLMEHADRGNVPSYLA
jgi:arylsulfatase A-like enzyme